MPVYLLHFERPYKHARHYLGATRDLEARLSLHRCGRGARLMAVVTQAGIPWMLARTWEGDYAQEHALKRRKNSPQLCPQCIQARLLSSQEGNVHGLFEQETVDVL
jgi:predicted GIY-YIG superfamily endonuclease